MGDATEDRRKAATLPEGDVVRQLLEQHAQIRELFSEVLNSSGDARKQSFDELRTLLVVHETTEETILRPVIRKLIGDDEPNSRDAEEAEATKELDALMNMDPEDPAFLEKVQKLEKAVDQHAEAEETHEFSLIEQECSPEERQTMGKKATAAAKLAPTRPHPSVAGHEKATMAAGPIAGLVDRTLDAIAHAMS